MLQVYLHVVFKWSHDLEDSKLFGFASDNVNVQISQAHECIMTVCLTCEAVAVFVMSKRSAMNTHSPGEVRKKHR